MHSYIHIGNAYFEKSTHGIGPAITKMQKKLEMRRELFNKICDKAVNSVSNMGYTVIRKHDTCTIWVTSNHMTGYINPEDSVYLPNNSACVARFKLLDNQFVFYRSVLLRNDNTLGVCNEFGGPLDEFTTDYFVKCLGKLCQELSKIENKYEMAEQTAAIKSITNSASMLTDNLPC